VGLVLWVLFVELDVKVVFFGYNLAFVELDYIVADFVVELAMNFLVCTQQIRHLFLSKIDKKHLNIGPIHLLMRVYRGFVVNIEYHSLSLCSNTAN